MSFEITKNDYLLDEKGVLKYTGWAKDLLLEYNRENITSSSLRIKEWDYYAILNNNYGITITITDLGILAIYNIVWLDFINKKIVKDEEVKLFSKGKTNLPKSSKTGNILINGKKISVEIVREKNLRTINIDFPKYSKKGLKVNLKLFKEENDDTIVVCTPWEKKKSKFYYNQKINPILAEGKVIFGEKEFLFSNNDSYAVLDWGRGVWPYKDTWYWSSASGKVNNKLFGFNLGYGFGHNPSSENIVFFDGKAHKLDKIEFKFNKKDFLEPWTIKSNDNRCELLFEPIINRHDTVNLLIFKSVQNQVFGRFSGFVILDNGEKLEILNFLGFAEEVYNRW